MGRHRSPHARRVDLPDRGADTVTMTAVVEEGKPAPDFTLPSDSGEDITLSQFRGRPVVLYFYPKDETPGS